MKQNTVQSTANQTTEQTTPQLRDAHKWDIIQLKALERDACGGRLAKRARSVWLSLEGQSLRAIRGIGGLAPSNTKAQVKQFEDFGLPGLVSKSTRPYDDDLNNIVNIVSYSELIQQILRGQERNNHVWLRRPPVHISLDTVAVSFMLTSSQFAALKETFYRRGMSKEWGNGHRKGEWYLFEMWGKVTIKKKSGYWANVKIHSWCRWLQPEEYCCHSGASLATIRVKALIITEKLNEIFGPTTHILLSRARITQLHLAVDLVKAAPGLIKALVPVNDWLADKGKYNDEGGTRFLNGLSSLVFYDKSKQLIEEKGVPTDQCPKDVVRMELRLDKQEHVGEVLKDLLEEEARVGYPKRLCLLDLLDPARMKAIVHHYLKDWWPKEGEYAMYIEWCQAAEGDEALQNYMSLLVKYGSRVGLVQHDVDSEWAKQMEERLMCLTGKLPPNPATPMLQAFSLALQK